MAASPSPTPRACYCKIRGVHGHLCPQASDGVSFVRRVEDDDAVTLAEDRGHLNSAPILLVVRQIVHLVASISSEGTETYTIVEADGTCFGDTRWHADLSYGGVTAKAHDEEPTEDARHHNG